MQPTPSHAADARLFTAARLAERARNRAVFMTAPHIAARAAKHREMAEAEMQWVRLADDPRIPEAFKGNTDQHRAAAEREYLLAYEEEN